MTSLTGARGNRVSRRIASVVLPLVALGALVCALQPIVVVATAPDYTTANGTPNTTAKFTAIATLANAWPTDDGTTWGVTSRFTIVEASGNFRSIGAGMVFTLEKAYRDDLNISWVVVSASFSASQSAT